MALNNIKHDNLPIKINDIYRCIGMISFSLLKTYPEK